MKKSKPIPPLVRFFSKPGSWCQGAGRQGKAKCLGIAIKDLHRPTSEWIDIVIKVQNEIKHPNGEKMTSIFDWNDTPGRTRKQVLAVCKKAGV